MRLTTLASSSSGNCTLVSQDSTHVLIDAGISFKRICEGLHSVDLSPADLSAVLVTHAHTDHTSGLKIMCKNIGARIHATSYALGAIEGLFAAETETGEVAPASAIDIGGLEISAFETSHDSPGSVGYCITYNSKKLVFATDLGIVTQAVLDAAAGAELAVIEANHDRTMVKTGRYPPSLKRRILSEVGHLSNLACGDFAARIVQSGTRRLVLAHLSLENNTPELAFRDVSAALEKSGCRVGRDVSLSVAPHLTCGAVIEL